MTRRGTVAGFCLFIGTVKQSINSDKKQTKNKETRGKATTKTTKGKRNKSRKELTNFVVAVVRNELTNFVVVVVCLLYLTSFEPYHCWTRRANQDKHSAMSVEGKGVVNMFKKQQ